MALNVKVDLSRERKRIRMTRQERIESDRKQAIKENLERRKRMQRK